MLENKTPDPNLHSFTVEDIYAKAEEIRKARDSQSSIDSSDLGEAVKVLTNLEDGKKKESSNIAKLVWNWTGLSDKKLWDIIQILGVPTAIAVSGFWFQDFTKKQELQLADSRAKQETLTKYLDQMSDLLEKGLLKSKQDSPIFIIAQSKTVTALQSLDTERQRLLIQFFKSANLNTLDGGKGLLFKAIMPKAQLPGVDLREINLTKVDFSGANLSNANLSKANLSEANLSKANLSKANLSRVNLSNAELPKANLSEAELFRANLNEANLSGADLRDARIFFTNVFRAIFKKEEEKEKEIKKALVCGSTIPENINISGHRACNTMAKILLERHPKLYKNVEEAEGSIEINHHTMNGTIDGEENDGDDDYETKDK